MTYLGPGEVSSGLVPTVTTVASVANLCVAKSSRAGKQYATGLVAREDVCKL
jgi:hypothetical protein